MDYVQRLRDLREDKDLNQNEIAKILGTSQGYYSKYELGKRELPIHHLITLCKFYNVSADYLLGFTDTFKHLPEK
ncbi:MAG: helix-turn-helix domain-containing protein [Eubacterium sp.]